MKTKITNENKDSIKKNDYFEFRYNPEVVDKYFGDIYHCFDSKLIANQRINKIIYLKDTYWNSENRTFTIDEALEKGELYLICNIDDTVKISEGDFPYYDDSDIINLSHQHGCHSRYAILKGVERSKEKMISICNSRLKDAEYNIRQSKRDIECLIENIEKIEGGDLSVYITNI